MNREDGSVHYHIRWSSRTALDWECFTTPAEAVIRGDELVHQGETYSVEKHGDPCVRCLARMTEPRILRSAPH